MNSSSTDIHVDISITPEAAGKIDEWRLSLPEAPDRAAAIQMIIDDWLVGHGMLPAADDPG